MTKTSPSKPRGARPTKLNPEAYFSSYAFNITNALWAALGLVRREYIDPVPTKELRAAAIARGASKTEATKLKRTYFAWTLCAPPEFDFHEGDTFWRRDRSAYLQVIAPRDETEIEVHLVSVTATPAGTAQNGSDGEYPTSQRKAYRLSAPSLAKWLETGVTPEQARIGRGQSRSEVLRFLIADTGDESPANDCLPT